MKKLVSFVCVAVVVAVVVGGCAKTKSNPYSGTYVGTLTSTVGNFNKENFKMVFINGVADESNLYLYGLPLKKISEEKYQAEGELVVKIIQLVTSDIKLEEIKDATFVFTFSTGKVNMDAKYEVLGGLLDVNLIKYEGKKQ